MLCGVDHHYRCDSLQSTNVHSPVSWYTFEDIVLPPGYPHTEHPASAHTWEGEPPLGVEDTEHKVCCNASDTDGLEGISGHIALCESCESEV